ncbi:MAG: U32 family peptidase [Bacilli bacterium]|nr:U32 family peptidase [Bacilli bacterium]
MKVVELLAPAGNMECLKAAVHAGCDAIYLAGKSFGARGFADNFTNDELIEAIDFCHLYNVKVYVTINTLIFDSEVDTLLKYVESLIQFGVDAVIVQDLGTIHLLHKTFPDLEIHASTQINCNNNEMVKYLKHLGVKRIVFARENSLKEINNIDENIEKEVFIHGALCVSYSGQCLFSSMIGGRSGNRGYCAGPCRLPYQLLKVNNSKEEIIKTDGEYLLSMKDLCTIENIDEILKSNIDSLKIEGRMKRYEYVYLVTSIYRKAIDNFNKYGETRITKEDINDLELIFNRDFTNGFIFDEKNNKINNSFRPNHLGVEIGKVVESEFGNVRIKLNDELRQGDGIRIINDDKEDIGFIVNKIYKNRMLIKKGYKGEVVNLDCKSRVKIGSKVVKTTSVEQVERIDKLLENEKKIPVNFNFECRVGDYAVLTIEDLKGNKYSIKSNVKSEKASKLPVSEDTILTKLNRIGHTPFCVNNININMDNDIFIPIKEVNEMKRVAIEELTKIRIQNGKPNNIEKNEYIIENNFDSQDETYLKCFAKNDIQLKACIDLDVDYIYVEQELYNKYKDKYNNLILVLPRINKVYKDYSNENLLIREIGSLNKHVDNNNLVLDYTLNVSNSYSIDLLNNKNVKAITLSTELTDTQIKNIVEKFDKKPNLELIVYGPLEIMITKYCILNTHVNNNDKCNMCKENNSYYLIDRKNERYKIETDKLCNNIIMSSKKLNLLDNIKTYKEIGINNFRLNLSDETYEETVDIINKFKNKITFNK